MTKKILQASMKFREEQTKQEETKKSDTIRKVNFS